MAGVNRCGHDPQLPYPGRSLIIDPRGQAVAEAGSGEGMIEAELDLQALLGYHREFPALNDMRQDDLRTES